MTAMLAGLTPACGSDSGNNGSIGGLLDGGGGTGAGGTNGSSGGSSGSSATTGGGGSGGGSTSTTPIGQPCVKDSDCGTQGLICLTPSGNEFAGGGVANGVCTVDCSADLTAVSAATPSACSAVDPNAICLKLSNTQAYCVESCTVGAVPSTEIKCHGRRDMACADPQGFGTGYCKPTCRGDFDCPTGRVCDLGDGICTDPISASRNLPAGSKCDPNATNDPCHGACVGVLEGDASTTAVGFCSGFCQLGEVGCGVDPTSKAQVDSYCLFGTSAQSDRGDLGFCAQLCDCNGDCSNPDFICTTVNGLSAQVGRAGSCGPKSAALPGEAGGIACTSKPTVDSGKTMPPADSGSGPDAGTPVDAGGD